MVGAGRANTAAAAAAAAALAVADCQFYGIHPGTKLGKHLDKTAKCGDY